MDDVQELIVRLKKENYQLIAVEQTSKSVDYRKADYKQKVAVFFGHERDGLSVEITDKCDICVELPMFGIKKSLNVSVAGGVILYNLINDTGK